MAEMTSKERMFAALRNEVPDRVPALPMAGGLCARFLGEGLSYGAMRDLETHIKATLAFFNRFPKTDMAIGGFTKGWLFNDLGIKTHNPPDGPTSCDEAFWKTPEEVDTKDLPDVRDPKNVNLGNIQEALRRIIKELGDKKPVGAYGGSTVARTADINIVDRFLLLFYEDPKTAHKMLKKVSDWFVEIAKVCIDIGADIIFMSDPTAGGDVISREHFKEFAGPYLKDTCKEVKKYADVPVLYHICGDTTDRLDLMADTGVDSLSLDELVDLAVAKEQVGDRVSIMGNVPTAKVMWLGTPEDVLRASKECIMKAGRGGGFILAPGCEIPPMSPFENLDAMIEAAEKYGKYPLKF